MRGRLVSRPAHAVLREAERLVAAGVRELLVISQDTRAYGVDRRHDSHDWRGAPVRSHITDLARELGSLGAWVRLHYVYPYPHVRELIPLMAEGLVLPYLDIPFQHSHPDVLRRMARPAAAARTLDEIAALAARSAPRSRCARPSSSAIPARPRPSSRICSTGSEEAQLDRVGCFQYEDVDGRPGQRPARPRARGGQGGALAAVHGQRAGDQRGEAGGEGRYSDGGHRRRGGRRGRDLPHPRPTRPRSTATSSSTRTSPTSARRPRDRHRRGSRRIRPLGSTLRLGCPR